MNILINDGFSSAGIAALEKANFKVFQIKVAQSQLANYINKNAIEIILVKCNTQIRKELIDGCPQLKLIGSSSAELDHIDFVYAEKKDVQVIHTPNATCQSVAEMVFAHIFSSIRFLKNTNQDMPLEGDSRFKELKSGYSNASELQGKTLGIIGFGRTGKEVAKIALGLGMKVLVNSKASEEMSIKLQFFDGQEVSFAIPYASLQEVLKTADIITLHVPAQNQYLVRKEELELMKPTAGIINTSHGSVIDEVALVEALNDKKIAFAGLDVFEKEPNPEIQILMHPDISLSPHIAGSTQEAQDKSAVQLSKQIINIFAKH
ncbi:NAD(P)-dependent oxidoreductase [Mesonia ostreae]|uniref:NAD(P)-dependent oxidoreductase n=1 Tax=Mesonia ostreae TaxID=861110 RepID=A0ABU2KHN7_9FLAO|nr:NAD(P)-dependent oxidoreductase [Mesonia ostreae]MDT0294227.1 NAD(P)-dependent oxidoreductase [Mesonia ostreae]